MRKLFSAPKQEIDIRPAFFALAALMMILLPTLLMITNPQKMIGIPLSMAGGSQDIPPTPPGAIEKIIVIVTEQGFVLQASVRKTDVLASSGDVELKTWNKKSWEEVLAELRKLKNLDPDRKRIQLSPALSSSTQQIVQWMDQLQTPDLFPEVVLQEKE